MLAGASLVGMLMLSSVAFAADTTVTNPPAGTGAPKVENKVDNKGAKKAPKLTATQKACIATATKAKTDAVKAANTTYQAAVKSANTLTDKTAKKDALKAARTALRTAKTQAGTDFTTAKAACMK